jgi:hypothetical protein
VRPISRSVRVLLSIAAVPLLLFGWLTWSERSFEHRLQPVASEIAGHEIAVDCQSFLGALVDVQAREGEVRFDASGRPQPKIFLTRPTCKRLKSFAGHARHGELDCLATVDWASSDRLSFADPCYRKAADTIYAVLVLAHESYHARGVVDEATANCDAIQTMAWTAHALGADDDEAELVARAMETLEPRQDPPYGTTRCHTGLELDLHPETADFPSEYPFAPPLAGSSD